MSKFIDWLLGAEHKVVEGMKIALTVTTKLLAFAITPTGQLVEQVIEGLVPSSHPAFDAINQISKDMGNDLLKVNSDASRKAIALRLGAEILKLHHSDSKDGIDKFLVTFQQSFNEMQNSDEKQS